MEYFKNVIEAAIWRRDELKELLKMFYEKSKDVEDKNVELKELPPPVHEAPLHVAEDGGQRLIDFEAYSIYLIKAGAICIRPERNSYKIVTEESVADVNVIVPPQRMEERLSLYREIMELWISRKILRACKPEMFLWDGSLRSLLLMKRRPEARYVRGYSKLLNEISKKIPDVSSLDDIADLILSSSERGPLSTLKIIRNKIGISSISDSDVEWISFLEWLEKLLLLSHFLEGAWEFGTTLMFITKTSRSTALFNKAFPDVYYLRQLKPFEAFRTTGKLKRSIFEVMGLSLSEAKKLGPLFPMTNSIKEIFINKLGLIEFYARLERGAPLLKFEIAINLDKIGLVDSEVVEEVVAKALRKVLATPLINGYPISLRLSHLKWRVTNDEVDKVLQALGLKIERGSREMLS